MKYNYLEIFRQKMVKSVTTKHLLVTLLPSLPLQFTLLLLLLKEVGNARLGESD